MKISLRAKLMGTFFILIVIPMIIQGVLSYSRSSSALQNTINEELKTQTEDNSKLIDKSIQSVKSAVEIASLNNQMATQKKIQRPSEDPVIAFRALRLRSSLSQVNQYYEKNIPDAQAWLEVTETALYNMNKILTDVRTQCVNGTNS